MGFYKTINITSHKIKKLHIEKYINSILSWLKKMVMFFKISNLKALYRDNIINAKESDKELSRAIALGSLFGLLPIWGYQMIAAGISAHALKLNKTITIVAANISLPPLIPFILYISFYIGGILLNKSLDINLSNLSFDSIQADILQYLIGSIILAVSYSLFMWLLSYSLLRIFRGEK